jgi:UDP-2,4-diacetamido-2,4,6-trideoxy-beta-L-altropyranose hydrolase
MNLLLRTDASIAIGTGHVMRCLALAQAWQDAGGRAIFATAETTHAVVERLGSESCEVISIAAPVGSRADCAGAVALAREYNARWMVVDGYRFGADYQQALKSAGLRVLFMDDNGHAGHYSADLVLNQNAHANEAMYGDRESYTRLLLGPTYALLRREFDSWRGWKRESRSAGRKVLVTMGGSDPENFTAVVIEALRRLPNLEATVVVGGSNPHFDGLQQTTAQDAGWLQLRRSVPDMPALIAWADVAVSAAGSTCWEMCMLGLPAILVDVAENQTPIARGLALKQVAIHLGNNKSVTAADVARETDALLASSATRASMSRRGQEMVDGEGVARVISEMQLRG